MLPIIAKLAQSRVAVLLAAGRCGSALIGVMVLIHLAALSLMAWSESELGSAIAFCLTWTLLNLFWVMVLRRPLAAAALSLAMIITLILLARLKQSVLFTTIDFVDLMIVDTDTITFLLTIFPSLARTVVMVAALVIPIIAALWWLDPLRVRVSTTVLAFVVCLAGLVGLSLAAPRDPHNDFTDGEYVSKFARSGVSAITEYLDRGLLESDAKVVERLRPAAADACHPAGRPPNIVMVLDESSFDISAIPNVKVPP